MIQRKQTVFFFLAALVFGSLLKLPLAVSSRPSVQFLSDSVFDVTDHPALLILTALGAIIAIIAIFLYKKRPVQLKLGYVIIVLAILLPLISFLLFTKASAEVDPSIQVADQAGMYLPIAAIIFTSIANYFIKKDDKLVKSMDRLR